MSRANADGALRVVGSRCEKATAASIPCSGRETKVEAGIKKAETGGISVPLAHHSVSQAQHCRAAHTLLALYARASQGTTLGEERTTEKLGHGESGSRGRLPLGPCHGRRRRVLGIHAEKAQRAKG